MKIAYIGTAHPLRGGLATYNERLATELQQMGHEVTIYSFSLQYPSFLFPGASQYTDEPAPKGLHIHSIINSINPFNWFKVGRKIRKERPDLIIIKYWLPFMGPCFGTILRQVKKNKHTRIICIADNIIPHEKRPGDNVFTQYFIKPVDAFLTMSREVLQDLRTFTDKPAAFNPHPLYDSYGTPVSREESCKILGLDPSRKYLLFFGFIRRYKGLDLVLKAMQDKRIQSMNIHLIVAGEFYEDKTYYDSMIQEVRDKLHLFTDFIPGDQVKYYFGAADLVVQPYRSATQSGITQIAYHFEKPMIVTDVGGLAEVVPHEKTGLVVQPEVADIASGIVRFFSENGIQGFKENMALEKKKYSWQTFTQVLLTLANQVK
jgi:glycosyltransferase involved in cell wall biosynthesis